jgi:hypothetical protein
VERNDEPRSLRNPTSVHDRSEVLQLNRLPQSYIKYKTLRLKMLPSLLPTSGKAMIKSIEFARGRHPHQDASNVAGVDISACPLTLIGRCFRSSSSADGLLTTVCSAAVISQTQNSSSDNSYLSTSKPVILLKSIEKGRGPPFSAQHGGSFLFPTCRFAFKLSDSAD